MISPDIDPDVAESDEDDETSGARFRHQAIAHESFLYVLGGTSKNSYNNVYLGLGPNPNTNANPSPD